MKFIMMQPITSWAPRYCRIRIGGIAQRKPANAATAIITTTVSGPRLR